MAAISLLSLVTVRAATPPVDIDWQQEYGSVLGGYLRQLPGGGYVVTGDIWRFGFQNDYWVGILDSHGVLTGQLATGGTGLEYPRNVFVSTNGEIVLMGYSNSQTDGTKSSPSLGCSDIWLVGVNRSGIQQWDRTVGSPLCEINPTGCQTKDGGFILAAQVQQNGNIDFGVARVDALGNTLWGGIYGGTANDRVWTVIQTKDGGYLLGGESISKPGFGKQSPHYGGYDFWLVRLDANGAFVWDRSYGGASNDVMQGICEMPDGSFILAGTSLSGPSGNKTALNLGGSDCWFVKIDAEGNKLWDRAFGGMGEEGITTLQPLRDGGCIAVGGSTSTPGPNKDAESYGAFDAWLIRFDSSGNKLWDFSLGGNGDDGGASVVETSDGGLVVGANSQSGQSGNKTTPGVSFTQIWVVKLSPERPRLRWQSRSEPNTRPTYRLLLAGVSNLSYRVDYSLDLSAWTPFQTNRIGNAEWEVLELAPDAPDIRFFRALQIR